MGMSALAVQALAVTVQHLKQFGLERILSCGASFRPYSSNFEMNLSANTLQQLDVGFAVNRLIILSILWVLKAFLEKKEKPLHCQCAVCARSEKYHKSLFKRISNFSTCSSLTLVLLWVIMGFLVYYIKNMSKETQVFEPFNILGLEPGASDSEIKKAYRRLSIQYHPDKNPDPEANQYFVDCISKAYQALTDPISRKNYEKYGHPDGRQGFQMGIALPQFLLNIEGASCGILLLWIVGVNGVCILLPLVIAVIYISLKVIQVHWELCYASDTSGLLSFDETIIGSLDANNDKERSSSSKETCQPRLFVYLRDYDMPIQEVIKEMTSGGVDRSIECTGHVDVMISTFGCVHDGWGVVVLCGVPSKEAIFNSLWLSPSIYLIR